MSVIDDFFDGIDTVLNGVLTGIPEAMKSFVAWFCVQVFLDALFPAVAVLLDLGFLALSLYGLWQGWEEIRGAPSISVAIVAFLLLVFSAWLLVAV